MRRFVFALCVLWWGCVLGDELGEEGACGGNLSCGASQGRIQVAPNPLVFGRTAPGGSSALTFQVANAGDGMLRVEGVEIVEGGEDDEVEVIAGARWETGFEIEAGGEPKTMSLEWRPVNETSDTAKLRFKVSGAANATSGVFEVPVLIPAWAPRLVAPTIVRFARVEVGETAAQVFFIENGGQTALRVRELRLAPTTEFRMRSLDPSALDGEGDVYPEVLAPGERVAVRVYFSPETERASSGLITFTTNDLSAQAPYRVRLEAPGR
jgi:hypothetical protein